MVWSYTWSFQQELKRFYCITWARCHLNPISRDFFIKKWRSVIYNLNSWCHFKRGLSKTMKSYLKFSKLCGKQRRAFSLSSTLTKDVQLKIKMVILSNESLKPIYHKCTDIKESHLKMQLTFRMHQVIPSAQYRWE